MNNTSTGIAVISLSGELEIGRRDEIHDVLQISGRESGVLLDFSAVTYADSTSLAELLRLHKQAREHQLPVALVVALPQFERLLRYAGLQTAFRVFRERGEALSYLAENARV